MKSENNFFLYVSLVLKLVCYRIFTCCSLIFQQTENKLMSFLISWCQSFSRGFLDWKAQFLIILGLLYCSFAFHILISLIYFSNFSKILLKSGFLCFLGFILFIFWGGGRRRSCSFVPWFLLCRHSKGKNAFFLPLRQEPVLFVLSSFSKKIPLRARQAM